jgi:hypothetical protein
MTTHYDTLEVGRHASPEVVRAAYRSLMQRFHPDRNTGDAAAAERASALTQAYEVLSDADRRAVTTSACGSKNPCARWRAHRPGCHVRRTGRSGAASLALDHPRLCVAVAGIWAGTHTSDTEEAELRSIRQAFASGGLPEARRRELFARKASLLEAHPALRLQGVAAATAEQAARTVELLDAPLVLQLGLHELAIPRIRLVLGSYDTHALRERILNRRERLIEELGQRLAGQDPARWAWIAWRGRTTGSSERGDDECVGDSAQGRIPFDLLRVARALRRRGGGAA